MRLIWRLLPYFLGLTATLVLGITASGFAAYYYLQPALPSVDEMRDIPLQIPLRIYSRDGRLIEQIGEKRRLPVEYKDIPELVVQAFLAAEDDRFFEHPGFDYQGIARAAIILLTTGSKAQGGSTITQQLAREYFLTRDRTFVRKAKELILAVQIENEFSKQEILSLYLNKIFLGQRAYGVAAAAEVYYGKNLQELTIAEAATIAGLPAAPSRLNPVSGPEEARARRAYVLRRMRELDFISEDEFQLALASPVESRLHGPRVDLRAPYVAEMARSEALAKLGEQAYTAGYQIVTTVDSRAQRAASDALREALLSYDRRHGFRGPVAQTDIAAVVAEYQERKDAAAREAALEVPAEIGATQPATTGPEFSATELTDIALQDYLGDYPVYTNLSIAVVTKVFPPAAAQKESDPDAKAAEFFVRDTGRVTVPWSRIQWRPYVNDNVVGNQPKTVGEMLAEGDVVYLLGTVNGWQLAQLPEAQGAFVALNPRDGATVALTGGFDYYSSKFNRATQTLRQPGSSFKPFIYSAALENGFTAATIVNDAPVVVDGAGQEESWRPENYSNRFYGPTRLREGLVRSMNLVSVRVLREVGLSNTLKHLRPFGFPPSALPRDLSLALGSGGASPWQMAESFSGLSSGGYHVNRYIIDRILDAEGNVIYQATPAMVCESCAPKWFDGREAEQQDALAMPEFETAKATDADAAEDSDVNAGAEESIVAELNPEVPAYASTEEMITSAGQWRPDYEEAPLFWENRNQAERIITAQNAYIIYDMMRDVINRGTGRRARQLNRNDLGGKTGTSNDRRDAWFSGFNSELVGIAWVGFDDDSRSLGAGEEGSRTALPMWMDFMKVALQDADEAPLKQPSGIVTVRISKETGKLASASASDGVFEIFRAGSEPDSFEEDGGFGTGDIFTEKLDDTSIF